MAPTSSVPSRSDLSAAGVRPLHRGGRTKADLHLVPAGETGFVVVKDFGAKRGWVRLWGRIQVRRETEIYRRLAGVPGLPAFVGRIDRYALAIEYLEGKSLNQCRHRAARHRYFDDLTGTVEAMHARGVIHNDLRGKDNVLVTHPDERVVLLDLAGAVRFRPGGLAHRLLFRMLAGVDRAALLKWKVLLVPEAVTDRDKAYIRRFERWRRLWVLNFKGYAPGRKSAR